MTRLRAFVVLLVIHADFCASFYLTVQSKPQPLWLNEFWACNLPAPEPKEQTL